MDDHDAILNPERVLVITAHPDDPEFMSGGTIAQWTQKNAKISYVIVTDGSKGSNHPDTIAEGLVSVRQDEQLAAARLLGVREVIFLDYPDGAVYNTPDLRRDLVRQIRQYRPDVVVTHDPTARILRNDWINHPDHLAVGDTALAAIFPLARDRLNYPEHESEGLAPHTVFHILLVPTENPNFTFDISTTLDVKIAAILEHRSQIGAADELEERMRQRAKDMAEGTSFHYGERFRYIHLRR